MHMHHHLLDRTTRTCVEPFIKVHDKLHPSAPSCRLPAQKAASSALDYIIGIDVFSSV